ncbi:hypothetical protein [Arthrobacter oryzae]|uniref:hypothetical protein n=1 Tax=Arthrobacter oryzae TaxID=409290 RepID=UPI0037BE2408
MRISSRSSLWLLLCLLAAGILGGATPPAPAPPAAPSTGTESSAQTDAELDAFLQEQIDTLGIPGVAIAVEKDGARVHSAAFGRAADDRADAGAAGLLQQEPHRDRRHAAGRGWPAAAE